MATQIAEAYVTLSLNRAQLRTGMAGAMADVTAGLRQMGAAATTAMTAQSMGMASMLRRTFANMASSFANPTFVNVGRNMGQSLSFIARGLSTMASGVGNLFTGRLGGGLNRLAGGLAQSMVGAFGTIGNAAAGAAGLTLRSFRSAFSGLVGAGTALSNSLTMGLPIGRLLGMGAAIGSVSLFAGLEYELARVAAVSHATNAEFAALKFQAQDLGRTTQFTSRQAAQAMGNLAVAGFSVPEIQATVPHVLNLAAAAQITMGPAAGIMAQIHRGQGLPADQASRVADVLTNAFTKSNTTVELMGESFIGVGPVARQMGMEIEETSAILMAFADNGIRGSQAGNNLRRILARFVQEPAMVRKAFNELGIEVADSAGRFRPMADIIDDLTVATAHLTEVERAAVLGKISGLYAQSALASLMEVGGDAIRRNIERVSEQGTAARNAEQMMNTLTGSWLLLTSAMESFGEQLGEAVTPTLRMMLGHLSGMFSAAAQWVQANQAIVATVTRIGLALGGVLIVLPRLVSLFSILWVRSPVLLVAAAITTIAACFDDAGNGARGLYEMIRLIGVAVEDAAIAIATFLTPAWNAAVQSVREFLGLGQGASIISSQAMEDVFAALRENADLTWQLMTTSAALQLSKFTDILHANLGMAVSTFVGVASGIGAAFKAAFDNIGAMLTNLGSNITGFAAASLAALEAMIPGGESPQEAFNRVLRDHMQANQPRPLASIGGAAADAAVGGFTDMMQRMGLGRLLQDQQLAQQIHQGGFMGMVQAAMAGFNFASDRTVALGGDLQNIQNQLANLGQAQAERRDRREATKHGLEVVGEFVNDPFGVMGRELGRIGGPLLGRMQREVDNRGGFPTPSPDRMQEFKFTSIPDMWKKMQESLGGNPAMALQRRQVELAVDAARDREIQIEILKKIANKKGGNVEWP